MFATSVVYVISRHTDFGSVENGWLEGKNLDQRMTELECPPRLTYLVHVVPDVKELGRVLAVRLEYDQHDWSAQHPRSKVILDSPPRP